jgi:cbb3-type cytochrome oxidase maturation protein
MESLYLLVPFSALLVLALLGLFAWALDAGQFDDLQHEGERILATEEPLDLDQACAEAPSKQ